MSKRLITRYLAGIVKRGTLTVRFADGSSEEFGTPCEAYPDVTIRFLDRKVSRDILLDPRLGAAEAFMEGRLVVERSGIMELVELLRANTPWDRGGSIGTPSLLRRWRNRAAFALESVNSRIGSRRNVAHVQFSNSILSRPENSTMDARIHRPSRRRIAVRAR